MNVLPSLLGVPTLALAIVVPVIFLQMLALAFIPSMLTPGARAREVGKALFCYTMQALGIFIMSISGVPALYGFLTDSPLGQNIYLSLLLIFTIGGLIFLVYEHASHKLEDVSKAVPHALFFYTLKFVGALMVILATVSVAITMIFANSVAVRSDFWVTPLIFILYGIVLSALTTWPTHGSPMPMRSFQKSPMAKPPFPPVRPVVNKPVAPAMPQKVPVSAVGKPTGGVMKGKKK